MERLIENMERLIEDMECLIEDMERLIENMNRLFEDMERLFEDMHGTAHCWHAVALWVFVVAHCEDVVFISTWAFHVLFLTSTGYLLYVLSNIFVFHVCGRGGGV